MVVRGTRAGHILIGILTMVSIYALASWAGLEALRSLLSFIVPYIGLAIIVLFQSEIRRTLARIGRKNWFGLAKGFRAPEALSEIMMAAEHFSQQKIGALIVLERDIGLRTFVESGVPLESRISRDILLSIFQPGLPLHDGAVIIQKDRISAAACFLPLTTNPALARQLGTRHRAAIGITEETDCLSLVVSEETGRISVAAFGELSPGLSVRRSGGAHQSALRRAAARCGPDRGFRRRYPADHGSRPQTVRGTGASVSRPQRDPLVQVDPQSAVSESPAGSCSPWRSPWSSGRWSPPSPSSPPSPTSAWNTRICRTGSRSAPSR